MTSVPRCHFTGQVLYCGWLLSATFGKFFAFCLSLRLWCMQLAKLFNQLYRLLLQQMRLLLLVWEHRNFSFLKCIFFIMQVSGEIWLHESMSFSQSTDYQMPSVDQDFRGRSSPLHLKKRSLIGNLTYFGCLWIVLAFIMLTKPVRDWQHQAQLQTQLTLKLVEIKVQERPRLQAWDISSSL